VVVEEEEKDSLSSTSTSISSLLRIPPVTVISLKLSFAQLSFKEI
jgi:hypothetical protein